MVDSDPFLGALNFMYISCEGVLTDDVNPPSCEAIEYPTEKEEFSLTQEIRLILPPNLLGEVKPL